MKHLFFVLFIFASCIITNAQSVSIAATEGGSVLFTPDGVVRTPSRIAKGIQMSGTPSMASKSRTVKPKPIYNDTAKITQCPIFDLSVEEARMVRNCLASVLQDDNPNALDLKAFNDTRSFILSNKDFKNSTKKLSIVVSSDRIDCIVNTAGNWMNRSEKEIQDQYDRGMRAINMRRKIISQIEAQETIRKVSPNNSVIRFYKNLNDQ